MYAQEMTILQADDFIDPALLIEVRDSAEASPKKSTGISPEPGRYSERSPPAIQIPGRHLSGPLSCLRPVPDWGKKKHDFNHPFRA